jgi:glycosyltransferase involved in cell wall biosynthesis
MRHEEILPPEACDRVRAIGEADIVVGIPSYNNARTIGHVVRAVQAGLTKYFPAARSIVLNSDGGSRDGTQDAVRSAALGDGEFLLLTHTLFPIHRLTFPYHGIPGKGSAFRCIFRAAELLGARACVVVDSDLRSIAPEWMQMLLAPVLELGFDYVAPYYLRHKFDGTITNSIVYPVTRALYGMRIRQPIGGDFGLSGRLAAHFLTKPVWESDVARYGIDIWMTTTAICDGFGVCQSFLGAKIHDAKDPGTDLSDMLAQVVGTVFSLMGTYEGVWSRVAGSTDTPLFGFRYGVGLEPVTVDVERMLGRFRHGVANLRDVWAPVINAADLAELERLCRVDACRFRLDDEIWVRVLYDLAAAFHERRMDRDHLVRSSLPLYMAWVASFVMEMAESRAEEVDARIERLSVTAECQKGYLLQRWRA